jgi:uncharacterized protein with HEPN domain
MPDKDDRSPLIDILNAISAVRTWIESRTYDDYLKDHMLRAAIERQVEIVSEASRRIPDRLKAMRADIPWRDVASVGNILRHRYATISDPAIWSIVVLDLPALEVAINAMLRSLDPKT